ncbi:hypothetical protein VTI74DRAFT_4772 [Chaetomium olivicolor]
MKQRRLLRFHGLKRPRVRQTWNKYNLFNLLRLRTPLFSSKTFFQQKWVAKSMTRGYHGEHIKEYQWERMFSRRLLSAVNMDPAYMARYDGSEQAKGRGSGLQVHFKRAGDKLIDPRPRNMGNEDKATPYMQMVFAPMERRLDIAIFRALFASSARQARQFVLHGAVTVNGKKMRHPGYLLNPGDMFQVDPERVMTATGAPKVRNKTQKALPDADAAEPAEGESEDAERAATDAANGATEEVNLEAVKKQHEKFLKELKNCAMHAMAKDTKMRATGKKRLRGYLKKIKLAMAKTPKASASEMTEAEAELTAIMENLNLSPTEAVVKLTKLSDQERPRKFREDEKEEPTTRDEKAQNYLQYILARQRVNPVDESKPYATPWRPRDWMSPFAFIPRYLEVNQKICAAVYLRHPVARPGLSEVPTPFSPALSQLTFNWYLRRR